MVNENTNIKSLILKCLFEAGGKTISGVAMSERLGISRVAIWKHISSLKKSGVDILSGSKGYQISNPDDLLMPFCFNESLQNRIFHFQTVESTMDKARYLAKEGAQHLSVVVAEKQISGRGRLNRKWLSSIGGLWFTLIIKPQTPPPLSYIYNFIASICLCNTLRQLIELPVKVKWPNDLLLNTKKLAGLLSEMETRGDMVEFINIGIGINVNNNPGEEEPNAISLADTLGHRISRRQILEIFLDDFTSRIQTIDPTGVIAEWKKLTSTIGSQVRIETPGKIYTGRAIDVDDTGALIIEEEQIEEERLKKNQKQIKKIIYGDCFHT